MTEQQTCNNPVMHKCGLPWKNEIDRLYHSMITTIDNKHVEIIVIKGKKVRVTMEVVR